MQQKSLDCRQMVKAIRDSIRREAGNLGFSVHPGYIKISLVPCTEEADEIAGGYSDVSRSTAGKPIPEDFANYEYTYAFKPEVGFSANEASSYVNISIKKKKLLTGNANEGATERVYVWEDFLEITVRVSGVDDRNKVLACVAYDTVVSFFEERLLDFSVNLNK